MPRCTVITGVSRGLGAALFEELLASGDKVLALGRRFTEAQEAAAAAAPERITLRRTDLADTRNLPAAAELAAFATGAATVRMVHNAAVIEPLGEVLPIEQVIRAIAVNLTAPILLTDALLAGVGPDVHVQVLFIGSGAARRPSPGRAVYAATKRAGEGYFETLAAQGVDAVVVDPGIMDTHMQAQLRTMAALLPDGERYVRLAEEGLLPSPVDVARKIAAEHLGQTVPHPEIDKTVVNK